MPELIRSTFPGRPGLSLVATELPSAILNSPVYMLEALVDGHAVARGYESDRFAALCEHGRLSRDIVLGAPIEELSLVGVGIEPDPVAPDLPEVIDMASLGAAVGSTEYFGGLPYDGDSDPDGGVWQ